MHAEISFTKKLAKAYDTLTNGVAKAIKEAIHISRNLKLIFIYMIQLLGKKAIMLCLIS